MKRYYVDLTHFENLEDRAAAYERVDGAAFLCSRVFSKPQMSGLVPKAPVLVGLEVSWNSARILKVPRCTRQGVVASPSE